MRAIAYIRVSTQEQATEGVSLAAQRAKAEAWATLHDRDLKAVYQDAGISGTGMAKREGLKAALDAIGEGDALVVYSISRLARSTKDMLAISETLKAKGADLVSLCESIDTTTAAGVMVFQMLAVLAEFERNQISERTKTALAYKKANGDKYSPVPFNFREVEDKLQTVKREAAIVAEVLAMRGQGATLGDIAADLNKRGIKGKRGGVWHPSTVRYLINRQAA